MNTAGFDSPTVSKALRTMDFAALLPGELAKYVPVVREALEFFLTRLSPRRLEQIVAAQGRLGPGASTPTRLVELLHGCPTLHKLGQVLARDRRLPIDFRRELQTLEAQHIAITDFAAIEPAIERELRPFRSSVIVDPHILAEASVAVVVPCRWDQGSGMPSIDGVLKLLKPGVESCVHEELAIWTQLGGFLDDVAPAHGLPRIEYRPTLDDLGELLRSELRPETEQRNLVRGKHALRQLPCVVVPDVLPFSTPSMTAMTRLHGVKATEVGADHTFVPRRRLAEALVGALLAGPIWSLDPAALFHADPHAGNLMLLGDGQLGILDWSLTGSLCKEERVALTQVVLAALTLDVQRMSRAVDDLSCGGASRTTATAAIEQALRQVRQGVMPGVSWLTRLLDDLVARGAVRPSRDLLLFRKVLFTLQGVIEDVCEGFNLDAAMLQVFLGQLKSEWPARLSAKIGAADWGTHLSNLDLFRFCNSAPLVGWRYWMQTVNDALSGGDRE